jgi:hypothetical protein
MVKHVTWWGHLVSLGCFLHVSHGGLFGGFHDTGCTRGSLLVLVTQACLGASMTSLGVACESNGGAASTHCGPVTQICVFCITTVKDR